MTTTTSTCTSAAPLSISSSFKAHHHRVMVSVVPPKSSSHIFSCSIRGRKSFISCEVALKTDASSSLASEDEEISRAKIGSRVRVKVPLKVYHVPKVPEIDLTDMEGELKQYVALWKGKHISANYPYKIEFFTEIQGRGRVKFFAHLKEDEFDYLD